MRSPLAPRAGDLVAPPAIRRAAGWSWLAHAACLLLAGRVAGLEPAAPAILFATAVVASGLLAVRSAPEAARPRAGGLLVLLPTLWSGGFLYSYSQPYEQMLLTQFLVLCALCVAPFAIKRAVA